MEAGTRSRARASGLIAGGTGAPGASWSVRAGFVLVPLSHSAGMNLITLLAFRYLTDNLAISAALAGALFAIVKVYDGILDPALGALSDRTRTRWGRRLPFLLAGGLLMPVTVVMVFDAPEFAASWQLQAYVALALVLHATAYTALTIPGMAMAVEVTDDYHERSALMSFRVLGNSLGVLLGSTLPAWLLSRWGATRDGHAQMAWVVAAVLVVVAVAAVVALRGARQTTGNPAATPGAGPAFAKQFRLAWNNEPFRRLAIAHVFVLIGTVVTSVGNAYYTKYVLARDDGWLGTYYVFATIGVVGSMLPWLHIARRLGKKFCYMAGLAGFGIVHLSWLLATAAEPYPLLIARALLAGVASGAMILFAYSMLSDAIRYDYIRTGLRREGAFAGLTSLMDKLSAAAGIAGVGAFLSLMGYHSSASGSAATQSASAVLAINISYTIVPAVCMVVALLVVRSYRLDESMLVEPETKPVTA